jgi:spastin
MMQPGKFPFKKKEPAKEPVSNVNQVCVHRKNVKVVALPIIALFNLTRVVAFYIWIVLSFIFDIILKAAPNSRISAQLATQPERRLQFAEDNESPLSKQKRHHRKAFELISKALKLDDEDKEKTLEAIELYRNGIRELEAGIRINVKGESMYETVTCSVYPKIECVDY